ncbi:MAG: hypothetical protein R2857_04345 [Vampirovibrionales bacterium]
MASRAVGIIGQLHLRLYDSLKLKRPRVRVRTHVDQLLKLADKREPVKACCPECLPAVERTALTVPEPFISHQQIMAAFGQANEPLLKQQSCLTCMPASRSRQGTAAWPTG